MKVFNRAIKLGGHDRTINSIDIRALEYDVNGNVSRASGTTVPTGSGYAKGCLFVKTDEATGLAGLYENRGTTTSASFMPVGQSPNAESLTAATKTVTSDESGTVFFFNRAGGVAVTLPAPALGLRYKFIIATNFTSDGSIATNGGADIIIGGVNELEVDTGDDGPSDLNADTITFNNAADTVGDYVELVSDGTSWFLSGQTALDGGVTLSTT